MKQLIALIFSLLPLPTFALCLNQKTNNDDLLSHLLETICPSDVRELKALLKDDGVVFSAAMVANRGYHNPDLGSFSIFESVSGHSRMLGKVILPEHFYFGHFTDVKSGEVVLDQESVPGKLLIEIMAYDFKKKLYNFYELVGSKTGPAWFYRGDSQDILLDNKNLKIKSPVEFGTHLRCSGCHSSGGPIMKELAFPHNDWWTKERGLLFGKNRPSQELETYIAGFIDASEFSKNVKSGMNLLQKGMPQFQSVKEKLRPLFCSTEMNLYSDVKPLSGSNSLMLIPSVIFIDPLLGTSDQLVIQKRHYLSILKKKWARFPETQMIDADHGFLAPGRSEANSMHVKKLISDKIIDEEFALDVLSIDFKKPLFSATRCALLKLIPESLNWKEDFRFNLGKDKSEASQELLANLSLVNKEHHKAKASAYLKEKQKILIGEENIEKEISELNELRLSVFQDEISKNPKGQILEPGFRVIFPVLK